MDATLRADLIRDEGLRLQAYRDSLGWWTIGVGHLLGGSPRMSSISAREADALLALDVEDATAIALKCIPAFPSLDPARQRALVNMAFNRGEHMVTSTEITPAIVKACETGDWNPVKAAIMGSQWAQQVKDRAARIADALVNPQSEEPKET